jgi:hypothetical protein
VSSICISNKTAFFVKERPFNNLLLIYFPVMLLFFQYQLNAFCVDDLSVFRLTSIALLIISAVTFIYKFTYSNQLVRLLIPCLLLAGLVLKDVFYAGMAVLFFIYAYSLVSTADKNLNNALKTLFFLNSIIMIIQLLGVNEFFYKFQNYSYPTSDFVSFFNGETGDNVMIKAHQGRMPGIFPSTIALSMLQILVFGQLIASKEYGSILTYLFTGLMFALSGSTFSFGLFALSIMFLFKKNKIIYFHLGFVGGLIILFCFFHSIFEYNYAFDVKYSRIGSRLFDDDTSLLTTSGLKFFILIFSMLGLVAMKKIDAIYKKINFFHLILFMILVVSPLIIHPIQKDIRYWFIIGSGFAQLAAVQRPKYIKLHPLGSMDTFVTV